MEPAQRQRLRRRYLSLGVGELVAAGLFLGIGVAQLAPQLGGPTTALPLWFALTPLVLILLQAGAYWLLARGWVGRSVMPRGVAATCAALRVLNPALLLAGLFGLVVTWPASAPLAWSLLGIWGFAVIEYVNYYVVRLSYPPLAWFARVGEWRKPRLVQDLDAARDASR